jgi:hypothetical protein
MPGVAYRVITREDLEDPNLGALNQLLLDIVNEINRLSGVSTSVIDLFADLDLHGHQVRNASTSGGQT